MTEIISQGGPIKYFVDVNGVYQGAFGSPPDNLEFYDVPASWIVVPYAPEYADQVWSFEHTQWGPSRMQAMQREDAWRTAEMALIADQLLRIEDDDPTALPGTTTQWRAYRVLVRGWVDGSNPAYPDITKRPQRPE